MKKLAIISSLILLLSCNVFADLRFVTLEEHVKESDLIVIGRLTSVSETFYLGRNGEGLIEIEKVVTSNVKNTKDAFLKPKDKLKITWYEGFACVDGQHKRAENQRLIWFLNIEKDGTVKTSNPGSYLPLESFNEVKKTLKEQKITTLKKVNTENESDSIQDALLRVLLVFIVALILYRLLYRARFKVKIRKEKKEKKE